MHIESALVISSGEKGLEFFTKTLQEFSIQKIAKAKSGAEGRRLLAQQDFDLVLINTPLSDESGESLSRHIASQNKNQVILIVKSEYYDDISAVVEDYGVLTVAKPINKNMFWFSLKLAKAAHGRLVQVQKEKAKLVQKIEDIRLVDRAKHVLVAYLNMTEDEAHKYIERQAMDSRETRRSVAEGILKIYENT